MIYTKIQTILSIKKCWSGSVICGNRNLRNLDENRINKAIQKAVDS